MSQLSKRQSKNTIRNYQFLYSIFPQELVEFPFNSFLNKIVKQNGAFRKVLTRDKYENTSRDLSTFSSFFVQPTEGDTFGQTLII